MIRTAVVRLSLDVRGVVAGADATRREISKIGKEVHDSAAKSSAAWGKVGTGMLAGGLAAGAVLGVAASKAMDFETAMSRAAAGTMANKAELVSLRAAAIDFGASTQYSATEAADAITAMGKAGVSTRDILGGGLQGALSLAAAGELGVADAAEIAATALTQFGLSGSDLPHVADLLAAGAGKAQGSVQDLSAALKYVGPVSKGMGVSIEETTGVLAEFASQGIIGEQAGTSLRGVMMSLTSPSQAAAKEMANLGIEVYTAQGNFIGMSGVAEQLHQRMGDLTAAERDQAFGRIFGNEQVTAARILYAGGAADVNKWTKAVNDSDFAQRQAAMLTDNLAGDVERLKGALDTAFISGGGTLTKSMRGITQNVTGMVDAFNDAPPAVQKTVVAAVGLTTVVGVLGGSFLVLTPRILAAKTAADELGISFARNGKLMKGAMGAGAVVGVAAIAAELMHLMAVSDAVTVSNTELAKSMESFSRGSRSSGEFGRIFEEGSGPFRDDLSKTSDALDKFAERAQIALGQNFTDKFDFGRGASMDGFKAQIDQVDGALANLVQNGHADEAAAAYQRLMDSIDDANKKGANIPTEKVAAMFTQYTTSTVEASKASTEAATATGLLSGKVEELPPVVLNAQNAIKDFSSALKSLKSDAFDTEAAADSFHSALNGLSKAAKDNGRSVKGNSDKAIANREALRNAASAALDALDAYAKNGATTAQVTKKAAEYKNELYKQARQAGFSRTAAKKYSDVLSDVPLAVKTSFTTPGMDGASAKVKHLRDAILAIPNRKVSVSVAVGTANKLEAMGSKGFSSGGPVYGPGTTTSDDIPAWLSDREYVQTAYAHEKYGTGFMDAVNSGRFPAELAAGYARGGAVNNIALQAAASGSVAGALAGLAPALLAAARSAQAASMPSGGSQAGLMGLAQWFIRQGARVSEHQKFGGVHPVHVPGSAHYAKPMSRAIDVNFGGGGQSAAEMAFFDKMAPLVRGKGFKVLWRVLGHFNHLHAGFSKGGSVGGFPRRPSPRFASGGAVGPNFGGISAIVSARQNLTSDDVKRSQEEYRSARSALAEARRQLVEQQRQLAEAERAAAHAKTKSQKAAASRRLAQEKRDVAKERREYAAAQRSQSVARANMKGTQNQFAYQNRPLSTRYHEAAASRNSITAAFLKNVQILAGRGYGNLARQLIEMGGSDAETLAAQAVKSTSVAQRLQYDFGRSASLENQLETMPARLALMSALKTMKNPTLASISQATGISTSDIQAAALAMRKSLGGSSNAQALLKGLGTNSTYVGPGSGSGSVTNVTVQVAATTNPWLAGERAAAGARRVLAVGPASRRF